MLLSLLHPKYNGRVPCVDPDCQYDNCMGNRLEVIKGHVQFPEDTDDSWDHFDYKMTTIKIHVKHWKNDRYGTM